jgi:hypothetical protein
MSCPTSSTKRRRAQHRITSNGDLESSSGSDGSFVMVRASSRRRVETNDCEGRSQQRSSKRSGTGARKVTFALDEKKRVKAYVRRIPRHNEGSQDGLWWTKDELEQIMEREQNVFEVFSKCCTSYVENVLKLWEQCEFLVDRNDAEFVGLSETEIEKIANAPARGMENDVVIALLPGSRDRAIKSVIESQRTLSNASLKTRTITMRRRYESLSRAAAIFAKNIADGDAQVAATILRQ